MTPWVNAVKLSHSSPQNDSPAMKKAVSLLSLTTPNSNRKRRRLKDTLAQLTKETEISPFPPPRKRPSAEHNLSVMSLLDISNTPETCKAISGKTDRFSLFYMGEKITTNASLFQKIEKWRIQIAKDMIVLAVLGKGGSPGKGEVWPLEKREGKGVPYQAQAPFHIQPRSSNQEPRQVRFAWGARALG